MLFRSVFKRERVCGVDVGATGRTVFVCAHAEGGKEVFERVSEMPKGWALAVAMSPRAALLRRIESPFTSPGKTRRVLPSLLDVQMPFSLEECSVAFTHMDARADGKRTTVASAARIDDLRKCMDSLKANNIDPMFVDVEGVALWEESARENGRGTVGERVAVLKAEDGESVLVLGTGSQLISAHAISSFDSASLKRLLVSAYTVPGPIAWRLCGSKTADSVYRSVLEELAPDWVSGIQVLSEPESFLARAIARRALVGGRDFINLRAGALQHADLMAREESRIKGLATILAACGILLGFLSFGAKISLDARMSALDAGYLERANRLAGGSLGPAKGIHALQIAERIVVKRLKDAEPILAPFRPSPASTLSAIAGEAGRQALLLEVASVDADSITLEGTASSWKSPEPLELFLRSKGMTTSLTREESIVDETVRFKISASGGAK